MGDIPQPTDAGTLPAPDTSTEGTLPPTGDTAASKTFTQADIDRIVTERLARERKKAEDEKATEAKLLAEKQMEEQSKWKELAEQRLNEHRTTTAQLQEAQAKMDELQESLKQYEKALQTYLAQELEGIPEEYQDLLSNLDVKGKLEWMARHGELLRQVASASPKPGRRPVPAPPAPSGKGSDKHKEEGRTSTASLISRTF